MSKTKCNACGKPFAGSPRFCPECGAAVEGEATVKPSGSRSSYRDLLVVVGVIALFSVGFFALKTPGTPPVPPTGRPSAGAPGHEGGMGMALPADLPQDYDGLINAGNKQMDDGQFLLAAEIYRRALEIDPRSPDARTDYGACLYAMGLPERALEEFLKVVEAHPRHEVAMFNIGIVYHGQAQMDSARVYWERYLNIAPDGASASTARQLLKELEG